MESNFPALREYLLSITKGLPREKAFAVFIQKDTVTGIEDISLDGTDSNVQTESSTELLRKYPAARQADTVIIAHNHPNGLALPSDGDLQSWDEYTHFFGLHGKRFDAWILGDASNPELDKLSPKAWSFFAAEYPRAEVYSVNEALTRLRHARANARHSQ